jgi:hypothetical protein
MKMKGRNVLPEEEINEIFKHLIHEAVNMYRKVSPDTELSKK